MEAGPTCTQVPKLAYSYWPAQSEVVDGVGPTAQRFIFKRQQFSQFEDEQIDLVQAVLDQTPEITNKLPASWDRSDVLRLLYAGNWDLNATLEMIRMYLEWHATGIDELSHIKAQAEPVLVSPMQASGGLYLYGRDHRFRPVIIAVPAKLMEVCSHLVPSASSHQCSRLPPRIRQRPYAPPRTNRMLDHTHRPSQYAAPASPQQGIPPIQELSVLLRMLQILYSSRLSAGFLLNCGLSLWDKVTPLLSPVTIGKVRVCREGDFSALAGWVSVGNREEKYGGRGRRRRAIGPLISRLRVCSFPATTPVPSTQNPSSVTTPATANTSPTKQ